MWCGSLYVYLLKDRWWCLHCSAEGMVQKCRRKTYGVLLGWESHIVWWTLQYVELWLCILDPQKECPKLDKIVSTVTVHVWKYPSIGWADWLFMLRRENVKDLRVKRWKCHPLLLFQICIKEAVVMQTQIGRLFYVKVFPKPCADIFRIIKLRKVRWSRNVARMHSINLKD